MPNRSKRTGNATLDAALANMSISHDLFKMVGRAVMARGGDMAYLRHALRDPEIFRKMTEILVPDSMFGQLRAGEYILHGEVYFPDYARMCSDLDVVGEDDQHDRASDHDNTQWEEHALCKGRLYCHPEDTNSRIMCIKHIKPGACSLQEILDQIVDPDYLPATHAEAYTFGMAYPELWLSRGWVALGSFHRFPLDEQDMGFLSMYGCGSRLAVGGCGIEDLLTMTENEGENFLCVRKSM